MARSSDERFAMSKIGGPRPDHCEYFIWLRVAKRKWQAVGNCDELERVVERRGEIQIQRRSLG